MDMTKQKQFKKKGVLVQEIPLTTDSNNQLEYPFPNFNEGRYYRAVEQGKKNFPSKDCKVVKQNTGLVYLYEQTKLSNKII